MTEWDVDGFSETKLYWPLFMVGGSPHRRSQARCRMRHDNDPGRYNPRGISPKDSTKLDKNTAVQQRIGKLIEHRLKPYICNRPHNGANNYLNNSERKNRVSTRSALLYLMPLALFYAQTVRPLTGACMITTSRTF